PVAVPYDFDYCGIVAPPYAKPPPALGISSVRQRLFRGFEYFDQLYIDAIVTFNIQKQAIYSLYQDFELLDKGYRKQTIKFLDEFYRTINNPKAFRKHIKDVGRRNLEKGVVVKGLE